MKEWICDVLLVVCAFLLFIQLLSLAEIAKRQEETHQQVREMIFNLLWRYDLRVEGKGGRFKGDRKYLTVKQWLKDGKEDLEWDKKK